jgi:hypothetical protein
MMAKKLSEIIRSFPKHPDIGHTNQLFKVADKVEALVSDNKALEGTINNLMEVNGKLLAQQWRCQRLVEKLRTYDFREKMPRDCADELEAIVGMNNKCSPDCPIDNPSPIDCTKCQDLPSWYFDKCE